MYYTMSFIVLLPPSSSSFLLPSLVLLSLPLSLLSSPSPLSSSSLSLLSSPSLIFLSFLSPLLPYSLSLSLLPLSPLLSLLSSPSRVCRQYMRSLNATEVEKIHEDSPTIPGRYLHISYTLSHSHVVSCVQRFSGGRGANRFFEEYKGYKVTQTTLLSLKN